MNKGYELDADYTSNQHPVPESSEEWARVEYLLQLSLNSAHAKIAAMWTVGNPHLTLAFEKRTQSILTLDSWVDMSCLTELNPPSEVCQRGFKFPPQGMIFPVGSIILPQVTQVGKGLYKFLLCKVGVGRSYCLEESVAISARPVLPEGYHSVYLHKEESESEAPLAYHHEYLFLDPAQVLPMFLVHFEYDPSEDNAKKTPICEACEEAVATLYCLSDRAQLCDDCDQEMHSANKLMAKHIRVPIEEKPSTFGECPVHKLPVEFFCPVCQVPVCVHCKMIGSHSMGECMAHRLISISEAYRQSLAAAEKDDPILVTRKQAIVEQLRAIDTSLKDVSENSKQVEELIYSILQEALAQLKQQTELKMGVLLGEELELRRQMEQMDWMESFLRLQQRLLEPLQFLNVWNRYSQMRSELHSAVYAATSTGPADVRPDLQLIGKVEVVTECELVEREEQMDYDKWQRGLDVQELVDNASSDFRAELFKTAPVTPAPHKKSFRAVVEPQSVSSRKTKDLWDEAFAEEPSSP